MGAANATAPRKALARGELLAVVDDGRVEDDLRGDVRHPLSDMAGAVQEQARRRTEHVEEYRHFSPALHSKFVGDRAARRNRLGGVAGGREGVPPLARA